MSVLATLVSMIAALFALAPTAHASTDPYCQNQPDLGDYAFVNERNELKIFHLDSVAEVFIASDGTFVDNRVNSDATTGHFIVGRSRTTTLGPVVGLSAGETATALSEAIPGVNIRIVPSVTTRTGATIDFPVPALTLVSVEYGITAYDVVFDLDTFTLQQGRCWFVPETSPHDVHVVAPTPDERFRVSAST